MDLKTLVWLLLAVVPSSFGYLTFPDDIKRLNVKTKIEETRPKFHFHVEHPQITKHELSPSPAVFHISKIDERSNRGNGEYDEESYLLEQINYDILRRLDVPHSSFYEPRKRVQLNVPETHIEVHSVPEMTNFPEKPKKPVWKRVHSRAKSRRPAQKEDSFNAPRTFSEKKPLKYKAESQTKSIQPKVEVFNSPWIPMNGKPVKNHFHNDFPQKVGNEDSGHHIFFHMGPPDQKPPEFKIPNDLKSWTDDQIDKRREIPQKPDAPLRRFKPKRRSGFQLREDNHGPKERSQFKRKPLVASSDSDKKDLHTAPVNSDPVIRKPDPADETPSFRARDRYQEGTRILRDVSREIIVHEVPVDRRRSSPSWVTDQEPLYDPISDNSAASDFTEEEPASLNVEDLNFRPNQREQFHEQGRRGRNSYKFGYNTGDANNPMARYEERDANGVVRGSYSYVDANGKTQIIQYESHPEHGFRTKGSLGYHAGGF